MTVEELKIHLHSLPNHLEVEIYDSVNGEWVKDFKSFIRAVWIPDGAEE
jgi:hypothetical protein